MIKEKKILSYFLGWLLVGYIILFIGTNNVFAATYDTQAITWYYRKTSDETTLLNVVKNINTPFYGVSGEYLNGFTTRQDHTFEKNLQYMITYKLIFLYQDIIDNNFRSDTLDRLTSYSWVDSDFKLLNTNVNQTKYECLSGICRREFTISQQVLTLNATNGIRFGVYTTEAKSIGFYSPSSPPSVDVTLSSSITIEDNSSSTIIDQNNQIINGQNGINDNITNSTNTITGSITETEDNINQNIDDMQSAIVDSNKENTDKEIESQKVCKNYNYNINNVKKIDGYISSNGNIYDGGSNFKHTDYIPLNKNENYTLSINFNNNNLAYCLYTKDKTLISCERYNIKQTFTINLSEDGYIRYSTRETYDVNFTGKYCENGNQALNDKLDGIEDALTDSSDPDTSELENSAGWLPAGPLDSILNLPLTMLNSLTNSLGKTCSPLNLTLPYVNKNIQIPCLSAIFAQITGVNGLWTWVGTIASVLILYNYLLNLYAWVDRVLTLRAEFDEAMGADMANWGRL